MIIHISVTILNALHMLLSFSFIIILYIVNKAIESCTKYTASFYMQPFHACTYIRVTDDC